MKKILFVSNETSLNGAGRSLLELALALKDRYAISFLLPDEQGLLVQELKRAQLPWQTFPLVSQLYRVGGWRRLWLNLRLLPSIRRYIDHGEFDIVHLNTSAVRWAAPAAALSQARVVWYLREYFTHLVKRSVTRWLVSWVADEVIVNSAALKANLKYPDAVVVYPGFRFGAGEPAPLPGTNRILYIGRVSREKGIDDLIAAVRQLPQELDWHLDLVGECTDPEHYHQLMAEGDLRNRLILHGFQAEVEWFIDAATVLVLPSRRESFGRVLVEAFARGRPVVATRVGGIPEIVDPECGILVEAGDSVGLAKSLLALLTEQTRARQMGMHGFQKVKQKFSAEKMVTLMTDIYERL